MFFFFHLIELKSQVDGFMLCFDSLADNNNWFDSKDLRNIFASASVSGFCVFGCYWWSLQHILAFESCDARFFMFFSGNINN